MPDLKIGTPSVLARFASPVKDQLLDRASPVVQLKGTQKRERDEIVVPVDGSGLNIYDVKQPRLITSYPVAPQTRFLAKPFSICQRTPDTTQPRRFTYAITETKIGVPSYEIVCFAEGTASEKGVKKYSNPRQVTQPGEMVVAVEVATSVEVNSEGSPDHFVVLVQSDGTVVCLSADLSSELWKFQPKAVRSVKRGQEPGKAEFACLCSFSDVEAGLLNGRQDLIAQIRDHSSKRNGEPEILCTIITETTRSKQLRHRLSICAIWILEQGPPPITTAIVEIDCWSLPLLSQLEDARQWFLDASRGRIVYGDGRRIATVDLSGTVPRVSVTFESASLPIRSFIPVGHSHLIFLSSHSVGVLDMTYQSVLSSTPIANGADSSLSGVKRKRGAMSSTWSSVRLVFYSAKSNLAVGAADGELVAFPVSKGDRSADRSLRDSTLLDSLAKGPQQTGQGTNRNKTTGAWEEDRKTLEEVSNSGNVDEFEKIFAHGLRIPIRRPDAKKSSKSSKKVAHEDSNGVADDSTDLPDARGGSEWAFESVSRDQMLRAYPERAEYALAKIFAWTAPDQASDETGQLTIQFLPKNVLQWLVLSAHFSLGMLNRALAGSSSEYAREATSRDLVSAFIRFDPEMCLLRDLLFLHRYLDAPTVVEAVRAVICSLRTEEGIPATSEVKDATNKKDPQALLDLEVEEAARDLDLALATLEHGEAIRGQTLWQALTILHSFPPSTIVGTLRVALSTQEIIFLIQLLRIELAHGGWTSRFLHDASPAAAQQGGELSNRAILLLVTLISCAVDAVNLAGWQGEAAARAVGEDGEEAEGGLPLSLRTDVSAALEGVHEAVFLKGLLGDFRRYSLGVRKSHEDGYARYLPGDTSLLALEGLDRYGFERPGGKAAGRKAVVPVGAVDQSREAKMLPLGCKFDHITRLRKAAEGVAKGKSKRHIGQEISRRVGPYSFEKVRF